MTMQEFCSHFSFIPSACITAIQTSFVTHHPCNVSVGGAGGLEAWVKIEDQSQWDGRGSPSRAVEQSVALPNNNTALTDLQTDWLCYVF